MPPPWNLEGPSHSEEKRLINIPLGYEILPLYEKSKPQGKECSHKTNKQQRAGEEQEWSPHEPATINFAPSDDGPPPPRPNPAPRGTVCSKRTAVSQERDPPFT